MSASPQRKPVIQICYKCRLAHEPSEPLAQRSGGRLLRQIEQAAQADPGLSNEFRIEGVKCFSVCKRPVTIGISIPGQWSHLYGDFAADAPETIDAIFQIARIHAASDIGIAAKEDRTARMRASVIARMPPLPEK